MQKIRKSKTAISGFTLMELVLAIIVISILFTLGALFMNDSIDNHRYRGTLKEMKELTKALIGDENLVKGNERVDFGYVGNTGAFPTNGQGLGVLATEFTVNAEYANDAWDQPYQYSDGATVVLESYAADLANGGAGLGSDIVVRFTSNVYESNDVFVTVYDVRGNILRGNDAGDNAYHIASVRLNRISGLGVALAPDNAPTNGSLFTFTGVPMGRYNVVVTVRNTNNYRQLLNDNNSTFTQTIAVYPKGPGRMQVIAVRLPGSLQ